MSDFVGAIVAVTLIVILFVTNVKLIEQTYPLINECEKSLPRDQKCVLIAIPEITQGENK